MTPCEDVQSEALLPSQLVREDPFLLKEEGSSPAPPSQFVIVSPFRVALHMHNVLRMSNLTCDLGLTVSKLVLYLDLICLGCESQWSEGSHIYDDFIDIYLDANNLIWISIIAIEPGQELLTRGRWVQVLAP